MKTCAVCNSALKFMNTPTFGSGKLKDEKQVCTGCYRKINGINPRAASNLKKYSIDEVKAMLTQSTEIRNNANSRLEEIKSEIQSLGLDNGSNYFNRREINDLPNILAPDERILSLVTGTYNKGIGILVATNKRLVFIDKGIIYGLKVEDFPLEKISSIQYGTGLLLGHVQIHTSGNVALIENVEKTAARKFAEDVRRNISEKTPTSSPQFSIADELKKFAELRDSGIITSEDFEKKKNDLLK